MLIELKKAEVSKVAGSGLWGYLTDLWDTYGPNKQSCMGEGRNYSVICYGKDMKEPRGWKASSKECAEWFCCSKNKGTGADYFVFKDFDGEHNITCPSAHKSEF